MWQARPVVGSPAMKFCSRSLDAMASTTPAGSSSALMLMPARDSTTMPASSREVHSVIMRAPASVRRSIRPCRTAHARTQQPDSAPSDLDRVHREGIMLLLLLATTKCCWHCECSRLHASAACQQLLRLQATAAELRLQQHHCHAVSVWASCEMFRPCSGRGRCVVPPACTAPPRWSG